MNKTSYLFTILSETKSTFNFLNKELPIANCREQNVVRYTKYN